MPSDSTFPSLHGQGSLPGRNQPRPGRSLQSVRPSVLQLPLLQGKGTKTPFGRGRISRPRGRAEALRALSRVPHPRRASPAPSQAPASAPCAPERQRTARLRPGPRLGRRDLSPPVVPKGFLQGLALTGGLLRLAGAQIARGHKLLELVAQRHMRHRGGEGTAIGYLPLRLTCTYGTRDTGHYLGAFEVAFDLLLAEQRFGPFLEGAGSRGASRQSAVRLTRTPQEVIFGQRGSPFAGCIERRQRGRLLEWRGGAATRSGADRGFRACGSSRRAFRGSMARCCVCRHRGDARRAGTNVLP